MYKEVFKGKYADDQKVRILILGESHHWSDEDDDKTENERQEKENAYSTSEVVNNYLENYNNRFGKDRDRAYRFFEYIIRTFDIDPEEHRNDFWDRVYFGNYIDQLCGVGNDVAKKLIKNEENRKKYNEQLFSFIREKKIDIVFCFSRKVYYHLPDLEGDDKEEADEEKEAHRLNKRTYCPGKRNQLSEFLIKPVVIYGLRHTSRRYSYRKYQDKIKTVRNQDSILNNALEVLQKTICKN